MSNVASVPKEIDLAQLSLADRLDLLDAVWASLAPEAQDLPMPAWHVAELDRRLAAMEADGDPGKPLDEVVAELKRRL